MKMLRFATTVAGFLLLAALSFGCATRRIDWGARIGTYSFDQAIADYGPPDKQAKLSDGSVVAEWMLRRGFREVYPTAGFYYHGPYYYYQPFPPTYLESYSPDYYLRLIFAPDGRLRDWRNFSR